MARRFHPIYSTLSEDPSLGEAIDDFVVDLAQRVDELQDLELRRDLSELAGRAGELAVDAAKVGYDALGRCAQAVEAACCDGSAGGARKALIELTEIARRVRLGHRGAV